jgi:diguanylate cyclase (GGDEF)-like protein
MPRTSVKPLRDAQRRLIELAGVRVFSFTPEPPFHILGLPPTEQSDLLPGIAPAPSLTDLVAPEDMAVAAACVAQAMAHPGTLCETELRLAEDPSSPSAWARLHALASEYGGEPVVHGSLLPIGGQKRAEALAEQRRVEFERAVLRMNETQRFLEGLQHTTELLQMAEREADGYRVVEQSGRALLPNWQGAVTAAGRDGEMALVASWGGEPGQKAALVQGQEADCWALRLGRLHHVGHHGTRRDVGPVCAHFGFGDALPPAISNAICVPFQVAPGQAGALHLLATERFGEEELQASIWRAQAFADTLRPSLANLHLRATLREQAERDGMTNLFNRRYFDDALSREISRAERGRDRLTLAIFDIDYFKSFNDAYGHEAGDEVIRTVARQLLSFVRSYDVACRIGGEELALLMPDAPLANAAVRLDQLREQIARQRTQHQGVELPAITVSVGVAGLESGDAGDLLRRADLALYASKNAGRNRLTCWTPDLDTSMPIRGTGEDAEESEGHANAAESSRQDCCPPGTPSPGQEARLARPARAWAGNVA